ncbi:MAG: hypothetical protein ACYS1C_09005, partial [Planctomycetota bacterium]
MIEFVFAVHLRLALHAALLFAVGLFAAWPVVRYRIKSLAALPMAVFRLVLRLIGPSPTIARMAGVIFGFNTVAIFIYMASGFHPLLPKVFGIWVGMNIGIVTALARHQEELLDTGRPEAGQWVPSAHLTGICGLMVLILELP